MWNKFFRFIKRNKIDVLFVVVLLFLTYKAWALLPELTIRSDGFMYMLKRVHDAFFGTKYFFTGFQTSAVVFGLIFSKVIGANLSGYYLVVLMVMLVIAVEFYFTVRYVTKKAIVAFSSSLLFSASYFGNWDMVTTHCYCFFLERVIPTVLLVPSFLFLHLFLERKKKKFFVASFLFYFFGVGIGHFSVFFTPFYLLYPIFWHLFNKGKLRNKIQGFIYGLIYLFLSCFFVLIQQINQSGLGPKKWTFTEFLFHPEKYLYLKKIVLQFVYWSQYPTILMHYGTTLQNTIEPKKAESLIPHILITYLVVGAIIFKRLPGQRAMLFTTILGTSIIFYLNAYFNQYDMLYFSGASRYLYFPTFLLAVFWSYFLWAVFWQNKIALAIVGFMIVAGYYIINTRFIAENFTQVLKWNNSTRVVFNYIRSTRENLPKSTLIIAPNPEFGIQEAQFFTQQIGRGNVRYMSEHNVNDVDTWEKASFSSSLVIRLIYDKDCDCIKQERLK